MFGLMGAFLRRLRYRRRWGKVAAAAEAAANVATADLSRREREQHSQRRERPSHRPPSREMGAHPIAPPIPRLPAV